MYYPLFCTTHYSLQSSAIKQQDLAEHLKKHGFKGCAITDYASLSGTINFYKEMKEKGLRPILGCQVNMCESLEKTSTNRQTNILGVLAVGANGWKELMRLMTTSNDEVHFYHKPRMDYGCLWQMSPKHLIAYTGHFGSKLYDIINEEDENWVSNAKSEIKYLKSVFGTENVYLAVQVVDGYMAAVEKIRELGQTTDTRLVGIPSPHYLNKEDADNHKILLCGKYKTTLSKIHTICEKDEWLKRFFQNNNFHLPSYEEMKQLHTIEELTETNNIANKCLTEDYAVLKSPQLPPFDCPLGPEETLRQHCRDGWKVKIANVIPKSDQPVYADRVKHELDVFAEQNLSSYFLIVQDIVNKVIELCGMGPIGRGSACGCLVSYLIGITKVDPIPYKLLFERFFNAARKGSLPDIDIDMPVRIRDEIIEYIKNKYGVDKVAQMITFNSMQGKGALKEVFRAHGNISPQEINSITENITDGNKIAGDLQEMKDETGESSIIRWALENEPEKFQDWVWIDEQGQLQGPMSKRFEQAIALEGIKISQSRHASGLIIGAKPLIESAPLVWDPKHKELVVGIEMGPAEAVGLTKVDVLGVAVYDKILYVKELLLEGIEV